MQKNPGGGPVQSNLCTLTAAACARLGLECELVHNGEEPEKKREIFCLTGFLERFPHFLGSCDSSERECIYRGIGSFL